MYKDTFQVFSQKEGSQHIAQEFALQKIEKLGKKKNVKAVFEFGIGIGTVPFLLSHLDKEIIYYGTEDNDFCIKAFRENLQSMGKDFKFNHINNFEDYSGIIKFDFIIIDGSFNNVDFLKKIIKSDTIILVEGDRKKQREFLNNLFPKALVSQSISLKKNSKFSPFYSEINNTYVGGYTVYRLNPTFANKIVWFIEKVITFLKFRVRKIR
jgi:spore coat polysaccharide biosynthesis predicted glycosyltransferase SpsG